MADKAEQTKAYILEKVAPVFNKKGYVATTLSDLTEATGLTKGAIYCHYENKEDLAVQAYKLMVKKVVRPLSEVMDREITAKSKINALIAYYREYHKIVGNALGGCPILNAGVDSHFTNPKLYQMARDISKRMEDDLENMLSGAIDEGFLKADSDASALARKIFSMIEGGVFMTSLHLDKSYLDDMMDEVCNILEANKKK